MTPAERARLFQTPEQRAQLQRNNRVAAVVVTAMGAAVTLGLVSLFQQRTPAGPLTLDPRDRPALGAAGARNTVLVYADYQCPGCQMFHATTLPRLKAALGERSIKLVFAHRVLFGEASLRAATAAECAYRLGGLSSFEKASNRLYAAGRQAGAGHTAWTAPAELVALAPALGLKGDAFSRCLSAGEARAAVVADSRSIARQGGNSTPGVVVNGLRLRDASWNRILAALN